MTERLELRWTRGGREAITLTFTYATANEASEALDAMLSALEEHRHAGTRSRLDAGREKVEP